MLMHNDKKKMATLIVSSMNKPNEMEEAPQKDGAEQDDSIALETAGQELISAIESKNAKAVGEAFKALMELCDSEEEMEPQEAE